MNRLAVNSPTPPLNNSLSPSPNARCEEPLPEASVIDPAGDGWGKSAGGGEREERSAGRGRGMRNSYIRPVRKKTHTALDAPGRRTHSQKKSIVLCLMINSRKFSEGLARILFLLTKYDW